MTRHPGRAPDRYRLDVVRREVGIDLDAAATRLWLWLWLATSTDDLPPRP